MRSSEDKDEPRDTGAFFLNREARVLTPIKVDRTFEKKNIYKDMTELSKKSIYTDII